MTVSRKRCALIASAALLLGGCGGGSGGGVASAPPPPASPSPSPTPTPTAVPLPGDTSVELLDQPATQEFAVTTQDNPIRIRYDASRNIYEVKTSAADWSALVDSDSGTTSPEPNRDFLISGQPRRTTLHIRAHYRTSEPAGIYRYSNLANWSASSDTEFVQNHVAIGVPTPASAIPLSGTASFRGIAWGQANVRNSSWGGDLTTTPMDGSVRLEFDFARGALAGSLSLGSSCDCTTNLSLGTLAFTNTDFARGSQTYSGSFATTSATGKNAFDGRLTGPGAEELIGRWSVPFMRDGAAHQAWGAWIAKRGN